MLSHVNQNKTTKKNGGVEIHFFTEQQAFKITFSWYLSRY